MKPLKRKWAQVSLALHYLGWGLFVVVGLIFSDLLERDFNISSFGVGMLGVGLMLLVPVLWRLTARCPHCGKRGGPLSWVYKKSYCSRCGHVLSFDDGPVHEEETPLNQRPRYRLKRGWARLVLALLIAGLACMAIGGLVFTLLMPQPQNEEEFWNAVETSWAVRDAAAYSFLAGTGLLIAAGVLTRRLKCPVCCQGFAVPWQRRGKTRWCGRCGAALFFEDELEYEKI